MTGKVVSLSRVRKTRARDDKRRSADSNAAKHGRSKAEREAEEKRTAKARADLDGHKTTPDTPEGT